MKSVGLVASALLLSAGAGLSALCPDLGFVKGNETVCYSKEEKGNGYYRIEERYNLNLPVIKGKPMQQEYEIFKGNFKGGWGATTGACGMNVFANYLYGLKTNIKALEMFIKDWSQSLPAVALYALATYMPVAKEVLMGVEMMSNAVAKLTGFNCQTAMQYIKEMNMVDSVLVKRCVMHLAQTEGDIDPKKMDYDQLRKTNPDEWYKWYQQCLNAGSIFDILPATDKTKWIEGLSLRKSIRCALFGDKPWSKIVSEMQTGWNSGALEDRIKVLLYVTSPEITASTSVNGIAKVSVGGAPVSFGSGSSVDVKELVQELLDKKLSNDIAEVIDEAINTYTICTNDGSSSSTCTTALDNLSTKIANFEDVWKVDLTSVLDEIKAIARIEVALMNSASNGNTQAYEALAEMVASIRDTYLKKFKKQVYEEVKSQVLTQIDKILVQLYTRKMMGGSGDLCKKEESTESSGGST